MWVQFSMKTLSKCMIIIPFLVLVLFLISVYNYSTNMRESGNHHKIYDADIISKLQEPIVGLVANGGRY